MDMEVQVSSVTDHREKTGTSVTTSVAERATELHNLLSYHTRTNGESVHILVGGISQVEGRDGDPRGSSTSLQYLLDCSSF